VSVARHTSPIPPSPSLAVIWWCAMEVVVLTAHNFSNGIKTERSASAGRPTAAGSFHRYPRIHVTRNTIGAV
jgi:hypothetical protein